MTRILHLLGSSEFCVLVKNEIGLNGRGSGTMCRNLFEGGCLGPVSTVKDQQSSYLPCWDLCCHLLNLINTGTMSGFP